jgi:hypothetical protein
MMSGDCICQIDRVANGYKVEITDPAVVDANRKQSVTKSGSMPWKDPHTSYVFKDVDEVLAFLKEALPKAKPLDEYGSTFDKAVKEASTVKDTDNDGK